MAYESDTRLFVGMLEYDTTDESLRDYFEQFGELTDYVVMKFPDSRRCKGFGFVTFKDPRMLVNCLNRQPHKLNGKTMQLKRATLRDDRKGGGTGGGRSKEAFGPESDTRLFVGMLDYDTSVETLKYYFEQFGELTDYVIMKYPDTMKSKGFGFVTFRKPEMLEACIRSQPHKLDGKTVQLKRATPRDEERNGSEQTRSEDVKFDSESKIMRKLFIGRLDYQTTEVELRSHFEQFGELVECVLMKFHDSGKSRGFGFVTYDKASQLEDCQAARPHVIGGKTVETKRATPRADADKPEAQASVRKIFIGGLNDEMKDNDIREYFSKFGKVVNVEQMRWSDTGRKRGFGFVEFDDYDAVDKVVLVSSHVVKRRKLEVKKALSKFEMDMVRRSTEEDVSGGGGERDMDYNRSDRGMGDVGNMGMNYMDRVGMGMNTMGTMGMSNMGGGMVNGMNSGYMGGVMENDWVARFMGRSPENQGGMGGNMRQDYRGWTGMGNSGGYHTSRDDSGRYGGRARGPMRGDNGARESITPYTRPERDAMGRRY